MVSEQQVLDQIPMLRRSARRLCRNGLDAEDLLQDAIMRCLRYRDGCNVAVKSWCYTILFNEHYTRSRRRRRDMEHEYDWSQRVVDQSPLDDYVDACQTLARIDRLSPKRREFLAAWLHLDDYAQVAQLFGIRLGTVKSRISRIREELAA